jgi:uncharacterized RDD family membrane protein YckC
MATIQEELHLTSADATEVNLPIAGIGSRSYAFLIDWHIRVIVALAWLIGAAAMLGLMGGQGFWDEIFDSVGTLAFYVVILPTSIIYFLYHPILEIAMKGRTPGKRVASIRVVTTEGQTPDASALLIRNIFRLIDSLPIMYVVGIVSVMMSPRQVRIGDMAAGTLLAFEKKTSGAAFDRFAAHTSDSLDLSVMEVAQDLLKRWNTLNPEKRAQIGIKLIASQGDALPADTTGHALDREVHERLKRLAHAQRT